MNRLLLTAAMAGSIALGSALPGVSYADDKDDDRNNDRHALVCYKVFDASNSNARAENNSDERLVLNILFHSLLSKENDSNRQKAYDIAGKYVQPPCDPAYAYLKKDMVTADGTLITSKNRNRGYSDGDIDEGTRMGVEAMGALRGCKNVKFDCTTAEVSIAPESFYCAVHTEGEPENRSVYLKKTRNDGKCRIFRDKAEDSK